MLSDNYCPPSELSGLLEKAYILERWWHLDKNTRVTNRWHRKSSVPRTRGPNTRGNITKTPRTMLEGQRNDGDRDGSDIVLPARRSRLADYTKAKAKPVERINGRSVGHIRRSPAAPAKRANENRGRRTSSLSATAGLEQESQHSCAQQSLTYSSSDDDDEVGFCMRRSTRERYDENEESDDDDSTVELSNYLALGASPRKSSTAQNPLRLSTGQQTSTLDDSNTSNSISQSSPCTVVADILLSTPKGQKNLLDASTHSLPATKSANSIKLGDYFNQERSRRKAQKVSSTITEESRRPSISSSRQTPDTGLLTPLKSDTSKQTLETSLLTPATSTSRRTPDTSLLTPSTSTSSRQRTPGSNLLSPLSSRESPSSGASSGGRQRQWTSPMKLSAAVSSCPVTPGTPVTRGVLRSFSSNDGGTRILKEMHRSLREAKKKELKARKKDDHNLEGGTTLMTMQAELRSTRNVVRNHSLQQSPTRRTNRFHSDPSTMNVSREQQVVRPLLQRISDRIKLHPQAATPSSAKPESPLKKIHRGEHSLDVVSPSATSTRKDLHVGFNLTPQTTEVPSHPPAPQLSPINSLAAAMSIISSPQKIDQRRSNGEGPTRLPSAVPTNFRSRYHPENFGSAQFLSFRIRERRQQMMEETLRRQARFATRVLSHETRFHPERVEI